ncbi:MAG: hypothetical protein KDA49_18810 [Rhodospirillaceae bacterium]|nr:hypothetical protein [Rhodospirillaceae bacterium]
MSQVLLRYEPAGPVSQRFFEDRSFVGGILGPIGSGKSTACVFKILNLVVLQVPSPRDGIRRVRWAIIRNTYPELRTTTMMTWHQWVPQNLGDWRDQGPPMHTFDLDFGPLLGRAHFEVIFLALDRPEDVRKLLSLELTGAWGNEARELPFEVLSNLQGRVGRYPSKLDGGATWSGILLDTNAPDDDHWWYDLFEERQPEGFKLFKQPSGRSPQAENLHNLPPGYYERAMLGQPQEWIDVFVDAKYAYSRDGQPVYADYSDHMHCPAEPLRPDPGRRLLIGVDGGLTPAAVIGQEAADGQIQFLDEIVADVHGKLGAKGFGELVNRVLAQDYGPWMVSGNYAARRRPGERRSEPEIEVWCDPSTDTGADTQSGEHTWMEIFRHTTGLRVRRAPSNSIDARLEAVRQPLCRMIGGRPGLVVSRKCRTLRKGFNSGYRYRRVQVAGGARFEDKPEKNGYSHVHDAAQYLVLGAGGYDAVMGRKEARERRRGRVIHQVGALEPVGW